MKGDEPFCKVLRQIVKWSQRSRNESIGDGIYNCSLDFSRIRQWHLFALIPDIKAHETYLNPVILSHYEVSSVKST